MSEEEKAGRKRRWVKPVLIISLALNLLFVGLMFGALWNWGQGKWGGPRHKVFESAVQQMITELPPEKRANAKDILSRLRAEVLPRSKDRRAARTRAIKALKADPFNKDELQDALADIRQIRIDVDKGLHTLALELVSQLSAAERARLLEIYRSKKHRRHRWRHGADQQDRGN